jgi:hypothetical protein
MSSQSNFAISQLLRGRVLTCHLYTTSVNHAVDAVASVTTRGGIDGMNDASEQGRMLRIKAAAERVDADNEGRTHIDKTLTFAMPSSRFAILGLSLTARVLNRVISGPWMELLTLSAAAAFQSAARSLTYDAAKARARISIFVVAPRLL